MTGLLFDSQDSRGSGKMTIFPDPPESLESNSIQIMTDHEGNRKIYVARGIQEGLETVDYCPSEAVGNSQPFSGPTESREPDGFFCWPSDQSLFVLLYHYMPTLNKTS